MNDIAIFTGSAHPGLAAEICAKVGVPLQSCRLRRFANDCLEVQLESNCRERDVYIVQPIVEPVQDHLIELFLMLDAARGASAARITVVMPHFAYARSDKKDHPRISISARLMADLLVTAGASRILTVTLHSPQVHGFFSVPVDHLHALHELATHFSRTDLSNTVVISPDLGNAKEAAAFAALLGTNVAAAAKQRLSNDVVKISTIIGDVDDRDVIVLDDEIAKGSTIIELVRHLHKHNVRSIRVVCTHGLFADDAVHRIAALDRVEEIVCTDTAPISSDKRIDKLKVLSIAPALAEAIRRIHHGESVSALFRT